MKPWPIEIHTHFLIRSCFATNFPAQLCLPLLCCWVANTHDPLTMLSARSHPERAVAVLGASRVGCLMCHALKCSPPPALLLLVCLLSRQNPSKISTWPEFLGQVIKHKYFPFQDSLNSVYTFIGNSTLDFFYEHKKLPLLLFWRGLGLTRVSCIFLSQRCFFQENSCK